MTTWEQSLPSLMQSHARYGVSWRLTSKGIAIGAAPPVGTPGEPMTVKRVMAWFGTELRGSATRYNVPIELLIMAVCAESAGGGKRMREVMTARREEPGYVSDDETPDRVSVGCMQTLLSTARAALGFPTLEASRLLTPAVSIDAGAAEMAREFATTGYDPPLVAAVYNAGGLYRETQADNRWKLRCFPLGTGRYIDQSVLWFNDAIGVSLGQAGAAPCFARELLSHL